MYLQLIEKSNFIFNNKKIRTLINLETKDIWFVAKDIADILEIKNSRDALSDLESDEKNTVVLNDGNRGNPNMTIISESGLYTLIMRSRKPIAKPFQKVVTKEILPSIRKNGYYIKENLTEEQESKLVKEVSSKYDRRFIDEMRQKLIDFITLYLKKEGYTEKQASALMSSIYNHLHIATCQKTASQIVFDVYKNGMTENSLQTYNTLRKVHKVFQEDYTSAINFYTPEMLEIFGEYYEMVLRKAVATIKNPNVKPTPQRVANIIRLEAKRIVLDFSGLEVGTVIKGVKRKDLNKAVKELYKKGFILSEIERDKIIEELSKQAGKSYRVENVSNLK